MSWTRVVPLTAVAAVVLGGCGGGAANQNTSAATTKTSAAAKGLTQPQAKVSFTAPKMGANESATVTAHVHVTGIKLDPAAVGKPAKQGQGHLHFSLDEGKYDYPKYSGANGKLAAMLGVQGKYSPSVTPTIVYSGLPPGKHELEVYVANNDHTNAGAEDKVEFTVKK